MYYTFLFPWWFPSFLFSSCWASRKRQRSHQLLGPVSVAQAFLPSVTGNLTEVTLAVAAEGSSRGLTEPTHHTGHWVVCPCWRFSGILPSNKGSKAQASQFSHILMQGRCLKRGSQRIEVVCQCVFFAENIVPFSMHIHFCMDKSCRCCHTPDIGRTIHNQAVFQAPGHCNTVSH